MVAQAGSDGASGAVVIVIDDDPAVLAALKFSLEMEGFSVATYRSGAELLAEPKLPQSGCLVIDFKLPEMDGLVLLDALRQRHVGLPAILTTSHPSPALRRRAAAQTIQIIEKPLLGDALSNAIRDSLGAVAH